MKIVYNHNLSSRTAYRRIDKFLTAMQKKYASRISEPWSRWNKDHTLMDFRVKILFFKIVGTIYLEKGQATLEGKIPILARLFSRRIREILERQMVDLLS